MYSQWQNRNPSIPYAYKPELYAVLHNKMDSTYPYIPKCFKCLSTNHTTKEHNIRNWRCYRKPQFSFPPQNFPNSNGIIPESEEDMDVERDKNSTLIRQIELNSKSPFVQKRERSIHTPSQDTNTKSPPIKRRKCKFQKSEEKQTHLFPSTGYQSYATHINEYENLPQCNTVTFEDKIIH